VITACCIIHNFIRLHDPDDADCDLEDDMDEDNEYMQSETHPEDLSAGISPEETERADAKRDSIAKAMWESYLAELECGAQN
ncbi:hypothetical protein C8R44DRAFT_642836, partial [Mycena epipterygia]